MPILVDFNQVMIASVSVAAAIPNTELNPDMIRHLFLNSVVSYKKKFGEKYGEIIICCDAGNNWRKRVYAYYKAKRAQGRAESPLDWKMIFETLSMIHDEIDEFFPYKVIRVDGAEGDDVIAALAKYFQDNEYTYRGLEEDRQNILIISSDRDFIQLQEFGNVSQWTPMFKKMITEANPREYRFAKIIGGDAGDGVPNIFSDDDTLVTEGKRQKPATEKRVKPVMDALLAGRPVPADVEVNFDRNKKMIDLVDLACPQDIVDAIIERYKTANQAPRGQLLNYFMKFRLKNLSKDIDKF